MYLLLQMVLTSMHKYRPRVLVVRARDAAALAWGAPHAAFSFAETEFIAVTAYQVGTASVLILFESNLSVIAGLTALLRLHRQRRNSVPV